MSLLPFFEWCEQLPIGEAIRNSLWLFPVIEAFHLVGLGVLGGAVLLLDLRLLGLGLKGQPADEVARAAEPWLLGSLGLMLASGFPLFLSEAIRCYYSTAFWVKMTSLLLVILFTFTVRRRVAHGAASIPKLECQIAALVSLALWAGVGWGGRWIGFS